MAQFQTFIEMGGYAAFVWPAFILTAVIMLWLLYSTLSQLRSQKRALERLQATSGNRRRNRRESPQSPQGKSAQSNSTQGDSGQGGLRQTDVTGVSS